MAYQFAEIATAPAQLFSRTEIPPSPHLRHIRPGTHRWLRLSLDTEANYRKNPHPALDADSIQYSINRHGYRTTDFDTASEDGRGKVRIVCIGNSCGFGVGLPESATLPMVFRDLLQKLLGREAVVWNLSLGGTSADFVTRMLFSAIPVLRPHVILLTCFPFNRREFLGETGEMFVASGTPHWQQRLTDPERWHFDAACRRISNPYNDLTNIVLNLKVWESLCDDGHIPWLYATEAFAEQLAPLEFLLREPRRMVGPGVFALVRAHRKDPATGLARDMRHAGIKPTRELAEAMFARLLEIYPAEVAALRTV